MHDDEPKYQDSQDMRNVPSVEREGISKVVFGLVAGDGAELVGRKKGPGRPPTVMFVFCFLRILSNIPLNRQPYLILPSLGPFISYKGLSREPGLSLKKGAMDDQKTSCFLHTQIVHKETLIADRRYLVLDERSNSLRSWWSKT